ncbi:MAG: sugar ABC transporter substrate-binding protein [Planctomycetota bacterium]
MEFLILRLAIMLRASFVMLLAVALGYWMFADTVRHHMPADESAPLRVSFWGGYEEYRMWKEMLASFAKAYPHIPVKTEYLVGVRYEGKIQQLLVANAAPDVILFQDEPFPGFVNSGKFEDLTPYVKTPGEEIALGEFWETSVKSFGRDEGGSWRQYGVPIWGGCNLVLYNKECFQRARVRVGRLPGPAGLIKDGQGWVVDDDRWTVAEFVRLCEILTLDEDGDGRAEQFGFLLPGFIYWLPWHWGMGARVMEEDLKRIAFLGPECEASLQLWQDLRYKYHVSPSIAELGTLGAGVGFFTGRVAMYSSGPWAMPFLNLTNVQYDMLHIPRRSPGGPRFTRITWDSVVIFTGSKKKKEAWRLIHHLASLECQRIIAKYQRSIPALKAAKAAFADENPRVQAGKFIEAAATYARMQPMTEHWSLMSRAWDRATDDLQNPDSRYRLTPAEAIGQFLSDEELMRLFPTTDETAADRYRAAWRQRQGGGR